MQDEEQEYLVRRQMKDIGGRIKMTPVRVKPGMAATRETSAS